MMQNKATFPTILAVVFTVFFIALAINPVNRTVWFAEIIPVVVIFVLLVVTKKQFQFSNTAYGFMAFWLFWHTIGGHYTFANVPFDWFNQWFEGDRNHFDRVGHLSIGFYAYAMVEWLLRKKYTGIVVANFFSLFMVMSIAAGYEIIDNDGFEFPEQGAKAAMEAKADIVVLCSADDEYLGLAMKVNDFFNYEKKKPELLVAGYPKDDIESLKDMGVTEFIHVKTNMLETLQKYNQLLGV